MTKSVVFLRSSSDGLVDTLHGSNAFSHSYYVFSVVFVFVFRIKTEAF